MYEMSRHVVKVVVMIDIGSIWYKVFQRIFNIFKHCFVFYCQFQSIVLNG